MDRSTRTNFAKLITTLRGPNGCYASAVLPNRRPSLHEREQLPGTLEDRWLILQCPQQNDSRTILSAVIRSTNAPRKSATIKATTIWFFFDIGFSFLTASEVVLPLTERQNPRKSGCFQETEVSSIKEAGLFFFNVSFLRIGPPALPISARV